MVVKFGRRRIVGVSLLQLRRVRGFHCGIQPLGSISDVWVSAWGWHLSVDLPCRLKRWSFPGPSFFARYQRVVAESREYERYTLQRDIVWQHDRPNAHKHFARWVLDSVRERFLHEETCRREGRIVMTFTFALIAFVLLYLIPALLVPVFPQ